LEEGVYKAVILEDKIMCGKCKHKLAEKKGVIQQYGKGEIILKCKHKDAGKFCNALNEILL
jgi:hypothetical protein